MKKLLLFLLLVPLAFAAWQSVAFIAMGISLGLLAVVFMVGFGFGVTELQILAKEEFFQLIVMGILVVALISTDGLLNAVSESPAFLEPGSTSMQHTARLILDRSLDKMMEIMGDIKNTDLAVSIEASQASQCNIMGMGFSVSGCGAYSMLATPLSMAGGIVGFAIGELAAISRLIEISEAYALSLLLPLGIVLRTFKLTRGAGGLLIALGISLHIMLPAGIIFTEMLAERFLNPIDPADGPLTAQFDGAPASIDLDCTPGDATAVTSDLSGNEENVIAEYDKMRSNIRKYLFAALVKATLAPVLALLMMASSIKALTSLAGSEVDVSAISRFV